MEKIGGHAIYTLQNHGLGNEASKMTLKAEAVMTMAADFCNTI